MTNPDQITAASMPVLELLTVDEFAERLKVSRTTVFGWLKNGDLRDGADYFRRGRILRFPWPFFNNRQPAPQTSAGIEREPTPPAPPPARRKRPKGQRGTAPAINFEY